MVPASEDTPSAGSRSGYRELFELQGRAKGGRSTERGELERGFYRTRVGRSHGYVYVSIRLLGQEMYGKPHFFGGGVCAHRRPPIPGPCTVFGALLGWLSSRDDHHNATSHHTASLALSTHPRWLHRIGVLVKARPSTRQKSKSSNTKASIQCRFTPAASIFPVHFPIQLQHSTLTRTPPGPLPTRHLHWRSRSGDRLSPPGLPHPWGHRETTIG